MYNKEKRIAARGNGMKLSTSTEHLCHELKKTDECIRWSNQVGFRHFNICFGDEQRDLAPGAEWDEYIDRIGRALHETGTDGVLAHSVVETLQNSTYDAILEHTWMDIRACDKLGVPDIVVHPLYKSDMGMREMYRFNKRFYRDVYAGVPGTNVHVLIENAADSEARSCVFASGQDLREFLEYMDEPRMGACWDTSHGNLNRPPRNNQYDNIVALGDKLRALHIADNYGVSMYHHHTFPLAGVINFDSVMCGLVDVGYKGAFNFEASYTIRHAKMMPVHRNEWHPDHRAYEPKLDEPSPELKLKAEELLYQIGRFMLEQYGLEVE